MKFVLVAGYAESLLNFRGPLIDTLIEKNFDVHVAAPFGKADSDIIDQLTEKGVHTHPFHISRTGLNPVADLIATVRFSFLLVKLRPDYVFSYTVKPVVYGSLAAWLARVPKRFALITGLGQAFQSGSRRRNALKRVVQVLYRLALSTTTKVFFQNCDDRALFTDKRIVGSTVPSVVVNGSGVDLNEFAVQPLPKHVRFTLIARLLGAKGIREYAAAAAKVKHRYPSVVFNLVGWVDHGGDSIREQEIDSWVESGTLVFLGRLQDVRPALTETSVFVLPTYYPEGVPRTILEAMSMGRAIITTDSPGCRETVIHGDNGFLVPVKETDALAQAMSKFLEEPDLIQTMGIRSRQVAENKYDVHKVNAHMLSEMEIK